MPANKTFRKGPREQRHHKHRLGRMLVPHGGISGLLFTVNPQQESKALRELQLYLYPLIADLETAFQEENKKENKWNCEKQLQEENREELFLEGNEERAQEKITASTSSLLAAELKQYVQCPFGHNNNNDNTEKYITSVTKEKRISVTDKSSNSDEEEGGGSGADTAFLPPQKKLRHDRKTGQHKTHNSRQWLALLETGCKGHIMVSIPFAQSKNSAVEEKSFTEAEQTEGSKELVTGLPATDNAGANATESSHTAGNSCSLSHKVFHNPLVRLVVERIFKDIEENPRPLMRHCFRLMPCELTCCPTLVEMQTALEQLLASHFPPFDEPKRLRRVGFSFKVKNNTGVEQKKAYLQGMLEATFPANRFVVFPTTRMKSRDISLEAMVCVLVLHATCAMGVQRNFTERGEYNLHAIGAKHLELSSSV